MTSKMHEVSTIYSPTGFALFHLDQDEYDGLVKDAKDLKHLLTKNNISLDSFEVLDLTTQITKKLFVDVDAFIALQKRKAERSTCVEIINDMIKLSKGSLKQVPPFFVRETEHEQEINYKPKLEQSSFKDFSFLMNIFNAGFNEYVKRMLFIQYSNSF